MHSLVARVAKEDIEISGTLVRASEGLIMNLPAANHDPAFLDNPGTFDIDRNARGTWPSATASTSASGRPSPASNWRSCCPHSCAACRTSGSPCPWSRSGSATT
ncbi:cytochrome P450 [Streptomyces antimycoticus]|uniref:cytochrome P450 n=1 Tax=Streptomyces antimycoticus TaxID=68175 RepID=UPI0037D856DA